MPLYDYRCSTCGEVREEFRRADDRHEQVKCPCGGDTEYCFAPPRVQSDIDGYVSMADGSWISSRSQHRDHLKRHGMRELGNEKPDLSRRGPTIPRESVRSEIKKTVDRMKSEGIWRVR